MSMTDEIARLKQENRHLKSSLRNLVAVSTAVLSALDAEMTKPSDLERGKRIAKICNALEMEKDRARFFALDIDFRTGKKRKKTIK
jgi:hypothetical protein